MLVLFTIALPTTGAQEIPVQASAAKQISIVAEAFSAAYVKGDIDALMNCYTSDAVIMPGGADIIGGPEDIRAYWSPRPGRSVTYHQSTSEHLEIVGGTAYDYGYYEGATKKDGEDPVPFRGKYTIVWKKGEDGLWRMRVDMWSGRARE